MREMTYREFRDNLADTLNRIEYQGETVIVTRRGKAVAQIGPVEEPAMTSTVTFTHPDFPRLALRATDLHNGTWRRELVIDGEVAWTKEFPDKPQYAGDAQYHASQGGQWVFEWSDAQGEGGRDFGPLITGLLGDIRELALHVANGRAVRAVSPKPRNKRCDACGNTIPSGNRLYEVTTGPRSGAVVCGPCKTENTTDRLLFIGLEP